MCDVTYELQPKLCLNNWNSLIDEGGRGNSMNAHPECTLLFNNSMVPHELLITSINLMNNRLVSDFENTL